MNLNDFVRSDYDALALAMIKWQADHPNSDLIPTIVETARQLQEELEAGRELEEEDYAIVKLFQSFGTLSAIVIWELEIEEE